MKQNKLTAQEIQNLSELLVSTNIDNVLVGLQILENYEEAIPIVTKELVLLSQLCWHQELNEAANVLLIRHFDQDQVNQWSDEFHILHLFESFFDPNDFEEHWHWFEKHEAARPQYMEFILQNGEYAGQYFALAEAIHEYYKKRLDWAERYLLIPLAHHPHDLNALITLAGLYKDGFYDYEKALACYNKMLEVDKTHFDALEAKGILYLDYFKDYKKAIASFELALQYHPKDVALMVYLADAFMVWNEENSFAKGEKIIQDILQNKPNLSFAWTIYANRLWTVRHLHEEAEKAYLQSLSFAPNNYNTYGNLAELYDTIYQDYEKAKMHYVKSFSIYMDDAYHLCNYISLLVLHTADYEDAKDYYTHLETLFFGSIHQPPEMTQKQWDNFQKAQLILFDKFALEH